jgi:hypothetical protein
MYKGIIHRRAKILYISVKRMIGAVMQEIRAVELVQLLVGVVM